MKTRLLTGLIIIAVYAGVLALATYVHPIFFDVFILFLAVFGSYEMSKAISNKFSPAIYTLDLISIGVGFAGFWFAQYFFKTYSAGITAYFITLAVMIAVTAIFTSASKKYVRGNAISTIFVMLYPIAVLMFSSGLNYFIDLNLGGVAGSLPVRNAGLALMFIVPVCTDVLAYLIGMAIRGKKLCPSISPNKTVAGAIGGLFGGAIGGGLVLLMTYLADLTGANILGLQLFTGGLEATAIHLVILGFVGSFFDQAGDLVASYVKRKTGIKDYSNLLPGHGGIMDRVDGFMFCGIFFYMYFAVMVVLV